MHILCFMLTLAFSVLPSLQATVRGERQPPGIRREGEHREKASQPEQRGAAVASPDQSPHVPCLLSAAPLLLSLLPPLIPILLFLTCSMLWLPHSLPWLSPAGSVLFPCPQSYHQSKSLPRTSHTHSQGGKQSELLPWPSHTHAQSIGRQSLQPSCLSQLLTEISSNNSHSILLPGSFSFIFFSLFPFLNVNGVVVHVEEKLGLWSLVTTGSTGQAIQKHWGHSVLTCHASPAGGGRYTPALQHW